MAENRKTTKNYDLVVFNETQDTLTFKEFRDILTGYHDLPEEYSNMEKIDKLFYDFEVWLENHEGSISNIASELQAFMENTNDLICLDESEIEIIIGGQDADNLGKPINFKDGAQVSRLEDGTFTVNGVEADYIRIQDYVIQQNNSTSPGHLRFSYKPIGGDN